MLRLQDHVQVQVSTPCGVWSCKHRFMPRGGAGQFGAAEPFCTSNMLLTCLLLLCEASAHHRSHSEALYCFAAVAAHALTVLPTHGCPCSMGHEAVCVVML